MADWIFRSAGTISTSGNPGAPAGKAVGDLLLLHADARLETETFNGPPTGWVTLFDLAVAGATRLPGVLLGRFADGTALDTPSGYDAWSGGSNNQMQIAAFHSGSYTDLASIVAASAYYGDTSSYSNLRYPGITPPVNGCLVISCGFKQKTVTSDGMTLNDPAALGTRIGFNAPNGTVTAFIWSYLQQSTAAAIAAGVWTQSIAEGADQHAFHVALRSTSALTKKLKILVHADAQSDTGIAGAVFAAPSSGDITGAKIGEFTGAAFEATLEGGKAVLKIPVSDFGGEALTTSDVPVVVVRNATDTIGPTVTDVSIIEE